MATDNKPCPRKPAFVVPAFIILLTISFVIALSQSLRPATAQAAAQPNVIFIMVDALRADHVSAYGYERDTTPKLDTFMADGVRFDEATSPSSWTFPSNVSMLTGHMPQRIRIDDWGSYNASIPPEEQLLSQLLSNGGYHTAGFVTNYYVYGKFGFNRGFDHYQPLPDASPAGDLNEQVFTWVDKADLISEDRPLFMFIYYYDPHTWYDPPPPYDTMYDPGYTGTLTPEVYGHGEKVVSGELVPSERDIEHLLALYDGEITYWDDQLDLLLKRLQADGLLDNALVIVTSDHGQMFGEHGKWVHRNSLYEEVLRVPLFIRYPGMTPGAIDTPVSTVDLLPTILDLAGLPVPDGLDGQSLRPLLEGQPGALLGRPIFAEMEAETAPSSPGHWIAPNYDLRSVKQDGWKYIAQVNNPAGNALYEVQDDSLYEQENKLGSEPDRAQQLHETLAGWFWLPTDFWYMPSVHYR